MRAVRARLHFTGRRAALPIKDRKKALPSRGGVAKLGVSLRQPSRPAITVK